MVRGAVVDEPAASTDWRTWNLKQWNERLLVHFFARSSSDAGLPVSALLVTPEALARVTGDPSATPESARDIFVERTLATVRNHSLLDTADDYLGSPGIPLDDQTPPFLAYLILSCIAAAESSDEMASERSYVARLRALTNDQLPENSLPILARLWQTLVSWLALPDNRLRYRPLQLPDPGGLKRIGYTTKLSFPDRRDQKELSELLDKEGLLGHEPPVGKVLTLVARERGLFRNGFQDSFDDFRVQSASAKTTGLLEHRFWAAVREAALRGRGRGRDEFIDSPYEIQLLAEIPDDDLFLFAATNEPIPTGGPLSSIELPIAYGRWRYAIVEATDTTLEGDALDRLTRAFLARKFRPARLGSYIEQGILPFSTSNHGLLELTASTDLGAADVVLVRNDLAADLIALAENPNAKAIRSRYPDWVQIFHPRLRRRPSSALDATGLARVWMLHESVSRPALTPTGGVSCDDGWLGLREVLPRIRAEGASKVLACAASEEIALRADAEGLWSFPPRDLQGQYEVEAFSDVGALSRRTMRFVSAPLSEPYKWPADETAWIHEAVNGTSPLDRTLPYLTAAPSDASTYVNDTRYLGRRVGEFVADPALAAWAVVEFGRFTQGRRAQVELALPPVEQSSDAKARRDWRKLLFNCTPDASDTGFATARHDARQVVQSGQLPDVEIASASDSAFAPATPDPRLDRLIGAVAARAQARCGMSWGEWSGLVQRFLGVDEAQVDPITRAWQEIAALDVVSSTRWKHRAFLARQPSLVAFRVGGFFGATLSGLFLPTTRAELHRVAKSMGAVVADRLSGSPFVPRGLSIRARVAADLQAIASKAGLAMITLNLDLTRYLSMSTHDTSSAPPISYSRSTPWRRWSLSPATPLGPTVTHWMRDDRPSYWIVESEDHTAWSYDLNTARLWASTLAGVDPWTATDLHLEAVHAYLPLPLARLVAAVGAVLPGPDPARGWRHRYSFSTPRLMADVRSLLRAAFSKQRAPET